MTALTFNQQDNQVNLVGQLTRMHIDKAFEKKSYQLLKQELLLLNFAQVSSVDTAGLAWLLMMIEKSIPNGCQLTIVNMPEKLIKLAKLTRVDNLIHQHSITE